MLIKQHAYLLILHLSIRAYIHNFLLYMYVYYIRTYIIYHGQARTVMLIYYIEKQ